jgi:toxin ParE1/3/4
VRTVVWSDDADDDLEEIREYSEEAWGKERAEKYIRQIFTLLGDLSSGLRLGDPITFARNDYLRVVLESHILYYELDSNTLYVHRILHSRMNQSRHLSDRKA